MDNKNETTAERKALIEKLAAKANDCTLQGSLLSKDALLVDVVKAEIEKRRLAKIALDEANKTTALTIAQANVSNALSAYCKGLCSWETVLMAKFELAKIELAGFANIELVKVS